MSSEARPASDASPAGTSGPRPAALAFIFLTVVLDVLALGVIIPILPKLIEHFEGGDTARAAEIYGYFGLAWALMQFVCSPILGSISDRFGRRVVILTSNFGLGFDYILMALAPTLGWLFVGRIISGITAASYSTAMAYIADVTPPEKRAGSYGLVGAAWGIGFVVGPALGGLLGGIYPRLPFWVAAALTLVNAAYGYFILPESLPPGRRSGFSWRRANPIGALQLLRRRTNLLGLATVHGLYGLAHYVLSSVFVLYAGYRYHWNERDVGLTLGLVGVCNILVQAVLIKRFVAAFGERAALLVGLFFGALGFAWYGLAPTGGWFAACVPVFALMGLYGPALQALMTRRVSPQEQGQLQGANASILGIMGVIGPGLFTQTFALFIDRWRTLNLPGAPYLLAAGLMLAAFGVALRAARPEGSAGRPHSHAH